MAHEVVMPQLGLSMEAGRIVAWLKAPGDRVHPGQGLIEVESDKTNIEVEAVAHGILQIVTPAGPHEIPVGSVIAYLLADDEAAVVPPRGAPAAAPAMATRDDSAPAGAAPPPAAAVPFPSIARRLPSSPAARRLARELDLDWTQATGTGPGGRIRERDVRHLAVAQAGTPADAAITISPLARQLAGRLGLDLAILARHHPGKRIERADVEATVRALLGGLAPVDAAAPPPAPPPRAVRQPLSSLRRLIAERMAGSAHTAAPVTLMTEVDASELVRLRETLKREAPPAPSYNAILAKITAIALLEHPDLNVTFEDGEMVTWPSVHLGIAVDTARGLVVPVVRHVEQRTLAALAGEMEDLVQRALAGKALPDELNGGTFTLTNLGVYGIDNFTPIINPPQTAILGVGRLVRKPAVTDDGTVGVRTQLGLSLTFDHRLVDGAPAARFLGRITQFIESPYLWLVHHNLTAHA
jgi:pyruvate dehydrogenase E2 component (dihydrolipoamide acetyltransferase)